MNAVSFEHPQQLHLPRYGCECQPFVERAKPLIRELRPNVPHQDQLRYRVRQDPSGALPPLVGHLLKPSRHSDRFRP